MSITRFSFPTTIHFGPGARKLVGVHLRELGLRRPLIVTDRGLATLPVLPEFMQHLNTGLDSGVYSGVHGNPTASQVAQGVAAYKAHRADCVIGFGGGAALDIAKVIAAMAVHDGDVLEYAWDHPKVKALVNPLTPIFALPTTSGTGSEVGRSSVVSEDDTHVKRVIFSPKLLAREVLINAMSPADVVSNVVDEESNSMDLAVKEENLSQAIGRGGQNIRLAGQLTGWELNVRNEQDAQEKAESETRSLVEQFMTQLDVDEEVASILVQEGFTTIDEVAYVPLQEMLTIEGFDEDLVEELRNRAKDVLLTRALAKEESRPDVEPSEDLLTMEGMDEELAYTLAGRGILTMEDLAEQSVDDLVEIEGMTGERAATLIMTARAPWFQDGSEGN